MNHSWKRPVAFCFLEESFRLRKIRAWYNSNQGKFEERHEEKGRGLGRMVLSDFWLIFLLTGDLGRFEVSHFFFFGNKAPRSSFLSTVQLTSCRISSLKTLKKPLGFPFMVPSDLCTRYCQCCCVAPRSLPVIRIRCHK